MGERNIGAEILDGIQEIKQFKKGKLALRAQGARGALAAQSDPIEAETVAIGLCRLDGRQRANASGLGARASGAARSGNSTTAHC